MFWKKKKSEPTRTPEARAVAYEPPSPAGSSQQLENATHKLAASLSDYSEAAYEAAAIPPDQEITSAHSKVAAARELIRSSRLGYALGRCIPEHIKYWGSWINREDFQQWVKFDCANIRADDAEEDGGYRTVKVLTVQFEFNGSQYAIVLRNEGMSPVPDWSAYTGTIDLWHIGNHVARFSLYDDISKDFSHWEFSDVEALRVGPWMKDILDIAAQIEARSEHTRQSALDEIVLKAARNIDLG